MKETDDKNSKEKRIWYAVQTFYCKEEYVGAFFKKKQLEYFIPMRFEEKQAPDGKKKRILAPAIHNLLFLEKTESEKFIHEKIRECPVPISIVRNRDTGKFYEIQDKEMVELRAICDPNYSGTLYVDATVAEARPGQQIRVTHGTFKGLEGKLVRYKNRSYVVIIIASLGVMVHIPKWYCTKI